MKKLFILAAIGCLCASNAKALDREEDLNGYTLVSASYEHGMFSVGDWFDDGRDVDTDGFGVELLHGFRISKSLPMFIEIGGKYICTFDKYNTWDYDERYSYSFNFSRISVPVSFAYRFTFNNGFTIAPYAGINFNYNITAKETEKQRGKRVDEYSYFNDEDMEGETWRRFQMGCQLGIRFQYNKFTWGVAANADYLPIYKDRSYYDYDYDRDHHHYRDNNNVYFAGVSLSVGYRF